MIEFDNQVNMIAKENMDFWIGLGIVASVILVVFIWATVSHLRNKYLMATGDKVEGKVIDFKYKRNSRKSGFTSNYLYHLSVEYSYEGQQMVSKVKIAEDEMARFFPKIVMTKQLPANTMLPLCVDSKKPKRIVPNLERMMRETYPEAFGMPNKRNETMDPDLTNQPNTNPYA